MKALDANRFLSTRISVDRVADKCPLSRNILIQYTSISPMKLVTAEVLSYSQWVDNAPSYRDQRPPGHTYLNIVSSKFLGIPAVAPLQPILKNFVALEKHDRCRKETYLEDGLQTQLSSTEACGQTRPDRRGIAVLTILPICRLTGSRNPNPFYRATKQL